MAEHQARRPSPRKTSAGQTPSVHQPTGMLRQTLTYTAQGAHTCCTSATMCECIYTSTCQVRSQASFKAAPQSRVDVGHVRLRHDWAMTRGLLPLAVSVAAHRNARSCCSALCTLLLLAHLLAVLAHCGCSLTHSLLLLTEVLVPAAAAVCRLARRGLREGACKRQWVCHSNACLWARGSVAGVTCPGGLAVV